MLNTKLLGSVSAAPAEYVEDVFSTYLYTGTGSAQTINNGIDLAGKGGMVWTKGRSAVRDNKPVDTVRGAGFALYTNTTDPQVNDTEGVKSFSSTGYGLGIDGDYNGSGVTFCSWTFRKAPKFFDVVTWTGNGSTRTIAHNLGSAPGMIIVKRTDSAADWYVYHRSNTANKILELNLTNAASNASIWNNTDPTSSVFSVTGSNTVNGLGMTYVAYLFAHDAGGFGTSGTDNVISCGSFVSGAGGTCPPVNLGYEPQWVLYKNITVSEVWRLADVMRGWSQTQSVFLNPNLSGPEGALDNNPSYFTPTATGFQSLTPGLFTAGHTYIYMAIRRPMKPPTSGTQVFSPLARTGNGSTTTVNAGFAPDMVFTLDRQYGGNPSAVHDKLRGSLVYLNTAATDAEASLSDGLLSYNNNGIVVGADSSGFINYNTIQYVYHFFRRATGFMDVVCYTGTGGSRNINHNLGAVPELIIGKIRSDAADWYVYAAPNGNTKNMYLNYTNGTYVEQAWNDTTPTSTVFSIGNAQNYSGFTFVSYLFASVAGVSKIGSYTGNGTTQTIACGFTGGARFVLIKRTDNYGDWYVWDTARGIVSGNDPHLSLNSTAAEVTSNDSVDPVASGFAVNQVAATNINVNAANYIFLAIA